jgi:HAD superfamily hydrolase (TIGR01509 family)
VTLVRSIRGVQAVLFDMDGTLVDSDAAVERAWCTWCAEYGFSPSTVVTLAHGHPTATTVRLLRPTWSPEQAQQAAGRQLALQYDDLSDVVAAPGAHQLIGVIDRLALPWCVVTSADERLARARLNAAGIDPPRLITIDHVRRGKPDPDGYLLAAHRLAVQPSRCLVVEDSRPGLTAGKRAGAMTASLRGLPADVVLTNLTHLARLLGT